MYRIGCRRKPKNAIPSPAPGLLTVPRDHVPHTHIRVCEPLARMNGVNLATTVSELAFTIGEELGHPGQRIEIVSPSGHLLSNFSEELSFESCWQRNPLTSDPWGAV